MAHAVVHFEIGGPDTEQLAGFYADLLGWDMRPVPGIEYPVADGTPQVTFYVQTDDVQAVLDKVNLLGGKTETAISELPGMATYARFSDLDGLVVGLVQGPEDPGRPEAAGLPSAPTPSLGSGAPVDWFEVLGSDADRSQRFYAEIFGWQLSQAGHGYGMADTGSARGIRGGIGAGQQGSWATVYARVPDVAEVLARAAALGGQREYGPVAVDDHMQTGALRDPGGAIMGVYSHRPH
jgi:uncharacterized protein